MNINNLNDKIKFKGKSMFSKTKAENDLAKYFYAVHYLSCRGFQLTEGHLFQKMHCTT